MVDIGNELVNGAVTIDVFSKSDAVVNVQDVFNVVQSGFQVIDNFASDVARSDALVIALPRTVVHVELPYAVLLYAFPDVGLVVKYPVAVSCLIVINVGSVFSSAVVLAGTVWLR